MEGWVKFHRRYLDSDLWLSEPFTKGQAWVDLFSLANHKDKSIWIRGIEVKIKRGQLARSVVSLSKRWSWSRNKTIRFLKWLKTEQQIEQQNNNVTTLISITNYDLYQVGDTPNDTPNDTAERQQKDSKRNTNKNVKKEKNINKEIYSRVINYLNAKTGKQFKVNSKINNSLINARLSEGFKDEDFKTAIDNKTSQWLNDPVNCIYLRPSTLFGNKFESYVNEKPVNGTKTKEELLKEMGL